MLLATGVHAQAAEQNSLRTQYIDKINVELKNNNIEAALQIANNCIEKYGAQCGLYGYRGWLNLRKDLKKEAFDDFSKSIELKEPDYASSYKFRADTYDFSNYDSKLRDIKAALEIAPEYTDAWWSLGFTFNLMRSGDNIKDNKYAKEAISALDKVEQLDSKYDSRVYRFKSFNYIVLNDCKNAINNTQKAITYWPENDSEFYFHIENLLSCGEYPEAIKLINTIVAKKDSFFTFHPRIDYEILLGRAWSAWGKVDFASLASYSKDENYDWDFKSIKKSLDIFTNLTSKYSKLSKSDGLDKMRYAGILARKGMLHLVLGDNKNAIKSLEKAISIHSNPTWKFPLAVAKLRIKDYKAALKNCTEGKNGLYPWKDTEFGNIACSDSMIEELEKTTLIAK